MKKLVVLVITIMIIPLVEALTILGQNISMLVLTPIILIFIFLVIFIFMIVQDKIKENSIKGPEFTDMLPQPMEAMELPQEESTKEELPLDDLSLKEEETPKVQPQEIQKDYLTELDLIKKDVSDENINGKNKQLNDLIKKFFAEYAEIKYKFTFEELEKELKKKNKKIMCFSDNLSKINYSPEEASSEDLTQLIDEFRDIIEATREEEQQAVPKFKKETEEKKKKINLLLKKGDRLINKDLNLARETYKEVVDIYKTLISREKESIRPLVLEFYNRLND